MVHADQSRFPVLARVDTWPVHLPDLDTAVTTIADRAAQIDDRGFTVFTLNLDHLVKLRRFPKFVTAYRHADLVTADGAPIVWLARRTGDDHSRQITRTTGADIFVPLACAAAERDLPVYLFGSTIEVLSRTVDSLWHTTAGRITIAGIAAPSPNFDPEGPEADAAIEDMIASQARVAFIALGAPKQEVFAARAVAKGCRAAIVCVGAAVDFVAGTQIRAPKALQRAGLEWAWRLATNPRRLTTRYAACARLLLEVAVLTPAMTPVVAREI